MTGVEFGDLFPRLLLAHAIGDFSLQTNWVFQYKVGRPWGVVLHVAIVSACTFILLTPYLHDVRVVGSTTLLMLIHLVQDKLKILKQRDESRNNMWSFLSDQFLHVLFIVLMSLIVSRWFVPLQWPFAAPEWVEQGYRNDRFMWMGAWYVLGTYGGHILMGYLRKSFAANHEFVLDAPSRKFAGFFERVGLATGLWMGLTYSPWWFLLVGLAVAPGWWRCRVGKERWQDFGFSAALGVVMAVFLYYS